MPVGLARPLCRSLLLRMSPETGIKTLPQGARHRARLFSDAECLRTAEAVKSYPVRCTHRMIIMGGICARCQDEILTNDMEDQFDPADQQRIEALYVAHTEGGE